MKSCLRPPQIIIRSIVVASWWNKQIKNKKTFFSCDHKEQSTLPIMEFSLKGKDDFHHWLLR